MNDLRCLHNIGDVFPNCSTGRLSENEIVFSRSRKAKIMTTGAPQEVPLG